MICLVKKKSTPCILVDTREKTPLWEPGNYKDFQVERFGLKTGDYSVKGIEDLIVIERKANVNELYINFTADRKRFSNEIKRMENIPLSFLVIESDLSTFMNPLSYRYAKNKKKAMATVLSSLVHIMMLDKVHVLFTGKNSRSFVKHLLLKAFEYYQRGFFNYERKTT